MEQNDKLINLLTYTNCYYMSFVFFGFFTQGTEKYKFYIRFQFR